MKFKSAIPLDFSWYIVKQCRYASAMCNELQIFWNVGNVQHMIIYIWHRLKFKVSSQGSLIIAGEELVGIVHLVTPS